MILFGSCLLLAQNNTFPVSGNVGIGTTSPTAKLDVNPIGSGQTVGTRIWAGNSFGGFSLTQLQLAWSGGSGLYAHPIKTRHNGGGITGNAIDFFLWRPGDNVNGEGSLPAMSLNAGNVIVGSTSLAGSYGSTERVLQLQGEGNWLSMVVPSGGSFNLGYSATFGTGLYSRAGNISFWSSPSVSGGLVERMRITTDGNVGIGTSAPNSSSKLNVYNSGSSTQVIIGNPSTGSGGFTGLLMGTSADTNGFGYVEAVKSSGSSYGDIILNRWGGNVGIGTTITDAKLTVKGIIHANEVKVDLSVPGPDYVFEKDYNLMTLEETKAYIDTNKHLPEVPSAQEMERNGVQLGEMNMLLLKKIEELTLNLITMNERLKQVENENELLRKKIEHK